MRRFIFVCSGNICRSPMAEGIAKGLAAQTGRGAQVLSMGTLGIFGRPASEHAVTVCAAAGIDISGHRSQGVSLGILSHADAVVVMERAHRELLRKQRPDLRNVMLFSTLDGGPEDVFDPVGMAIEQYQACFDRLRAGLPRLFALYP